MLQTYPRRTAGDMADCIIRVGAARVDRAEDITSHDTGGATGTEDEHDQE